MEFRYEHFDGSLFENINREKMKQLFLELLLKTSGNAEMALKYLKRLFDQHNLEQALGMSFAEFREWLKEQQLLEQDRQTGALAATQRADREIQKAAFEEIFQDLGSDTFGDHPGRTAGRGGDKLAETRRYAFGDEIVDIDFTSSIGNAVRRSGVDDDFRMDEDDLETHQREQLTSCATVILIDISHSMILYGEDRITPAKKVAMALIEYIQQRYPKDSIDVALFGDEAVEVPAAEVARVSVGPFHTNTKAGLQLAQRLLLRRKAVNKQVFMITDGKPSAITEQGELYKNPFGLDPKIVTQTINEATQLRRKGITITTFMITTDPHLQDFVDRMTKANKGRAYYASLDNLGSFIFADYAKNKKKRV
ncbi:MAG: VWA domain-containing protein [Candidatus Sumerlaeia bacterium]|nr:VWA domain-containing protein [Candidatus Sumerlaeia bacterium]